MKNLIKMYQDAYYSGNPLITDEQYDALIDACAEYEVSIGPKGDIEHLNPMYSLQKVYPGRGDSLIDYGYEPVFTTPKLDGAAIELVYQRIGEDLFVLKHMCTRGDVTSGKLIPHKRHVGLGIPSSFECKTDHNFLQVTGEVVTTKELENARNIASGKIQLDDDQEFLLACNELGLRFFAYNVQHENKIPLTPSFYKDMVELAKFGFSTVVGVPDLLSANPTIKINFDGQVYRIDDNQAFLDAGFTAKFPKGAFAVKEDKDFVVTTLIDVEWNTGRTGKVVPKAIIEPVMIEGAKVSRATLNNPKFIEAMGLYKGCKVKVIRSGEIIPCIIGLYE